MRSCISVLRWARWGALLCAWLAMAGAHASTYSTGTNACSGCHGTGGTGTPPRLPSQFSSILVNADLSQSCTSGPQPCSLRERITNYSSMKNAIPPVTGSFTDAELEDVRLYLLKVRDSVVTNTVASFSPTVLGQSSTATLSITVHNYRGDIVNHSGAIGYSVNLANTDFALVSPPSSASCAATAGTTSTDCTISLTVRFQPTVAGPRTATLSVVLTAADGADPDPADGSISLSAVGVTPTSGFTATPNPQTFTARANGPADSQTVTIANPGSATANLNLTGYTFSRSEYKRNTVSSTCGNATSLAPGDGCTLVIDFLPTAAGTGINGNVVVAHNAGSGSSTLTLNGTGTQSTISPVTSLLTFPDTQLGVPSASQSITVSNTGSATLNFAATPIVRSGANQADYSFTSTCATGTPLAAVVPPAVVGGSCTITVVFTPGAVAPPSRVATLTVSSDATNGPLVISLTGNGVALPSPEVTFLATDFPDTVIGETSASSQQVTIKNKRTRAVTYTVVAAADFNKGADPCAGTISGGATCTIGMNFVPVLGAGEGRRVEAVTFNFAGTGGDANPSPVPGNLAGKALLPLGLSAPTLSPAAVDGTPTLATLVLSNRSVAAVTLASFGFSDTSAAEYTRDPSSTCANASVLAPGGSCSLVLAFNPPALANGVRNATLTITHSALGSPQTVSLRGVATPAPQGAIALDTTPLLFPDTQLGGSSSISRTVRNTGTLALTFSAFTLTGANPTEFARSGTCDTAAPLPKTTGECTLTITFQPTGLSTRTANLTIASDASNGPATLNFSGKGTPVPVPVVSLPSSLAFGLQTAGGLYPTRGVTLTNSGNATLNIASIAVQGAAFSSAPTSTCQSTLAALASCTIDIAYVATAAGATDSGSISIASNAAGSPRAVSLTGQGTAAVVPVLVWSPLVSSLDFGTVSAGSVSATQSVTLVNQGPGGVTLSLVNAVGVNAANFAVVGGTCVAGLTLFQAAPGATSGAGTCTLSLLFAPGSSGDKNAAVQVASTGSFPPTLALHGIGLGGPAPSLAVSATALSFDAIRIGTQSVPTEVTLSSNGSGVVRVTGMVVSGPFAMQNKTCPSAPFTLQAGAECTVTVTFVPQAEGDAPGLLSVSTDASPALREVALSGKGEAKADVSSGGCSIGTGDSLADPTLWVLSLLAVAALLYRQRERRRSRVPAHPSLHQAQPRADQPRRRQP